jgi:hypothetical protein
LLGKPFPCPVCGMALAIRIARTGKPYCHCDPCGIQLFFRHREGIQKLQKILESEMLIAGTGSKASSAVILYNRLQHLKNQKRELENQQGIFSSDADLDKAIAVVQSDIEIIQSRLEDISQSDRKKKS